MKQKITFELTVDQIEVIRILLGSDDSIRLFGYDRGDAYDGDAGWMGLQNMFKTWIGDLEGNGTTVNGFHFNHEVNALMRERDNSRPFVDYWQQRLSSTKRLFGVE